MRKVLAGKVNQVQDIKVRYLVEEIGQADLRHPPPQEVRLNEQLPQIIQRIQQQKSAPYICLKKRLYLGYQPYMHRFKKDK